jgi:hypothetical protein
MPSFFNGLRLVVASGLTLCCLTGTARARTWRDNTGKYSIDADFVAVKPAKVTLKKSDGSFVTIALDRLSHEGQRQASDYAEIGRSTPAQFWTDSAGDYSVIAEFVALVPAKVTLKKLDGSLVDVPLDKLSIADQDTVKTGLIIAQKVIDDCRIQISESRVRMATDPVGAARGLQLLRDRVGAVPELSSAQRRELTAQVTDLIDQCRQLGIQKGQGDKLEGGIKPGQAPKDSSGLGEFVADLIRAFAGSAEPEGPAAIRDTTSKTSMPNTISSSPAVVPADKKQQLAALEPRFATQLFAGGGSQARRQDKNTLLQLYKSPWGAWHDPFPMDIVIVTDKVATSMGPSTPIPGQHKVIFVDEELVGTELSLNYRRRNQAEEAFDKFLDKFGKPNRDIRQDSHSPHLLRRAVWEVDDSKYLFAAELSEYFPEDPSVTQCYLVQSIVNKAEIERLSTKDQALPYFYSRLLPGAEDETRQPFDGNLHLSRAIGNPVNTPVGQMHPRGAAENQLDNSYTASPLHPLSGQADPRAFRNNGWEAVEARVRDLEGSQLTKDRVESDIATIKAMAEKAYMSGAEVFDLLDYATRSAAATGVNGPLVVQSTMQGIAFKAVMLDQNANRGGTAGGYP